MKVVDNASAKRADLAEAQTRGLFSGVWPMEGRVSLYISNSDESTTGDNKGVFVVGGYVAPADKWPEFSKRWVSEVLQPYPAIPYIHMVDLRSREWREKHCICREQASEKERSAIEVITTSKFLKPFLGRMPQSHYIEALERVRRKGYKTKKNAGHPDYPVYMTYAFLVIQNLSLDNEVDRVDFIMSRKQSVSHHISARFTDDMKNSLGADHPRMAEIVGDFIPLSMEHHMPLQAADVICWYMRRYFSGELKEEDYDNAELLGQDVRVLEMGKDMLDQFGELLPETDEDDIDLEENAPSQ
jgi:hypothetical protein